MRKNGLSLERSCDVFVGELLILPVIRLFSSEYAAADLIDVPALPSPILLTKLVLLSNILDRCELVHVVLCLLEFALLAE